MQEQVGKTITKECSKIFPLENVLIKKVKVLKKPKFDLTKLMELYQSSSNQMQRIEKPTDGETPQNAIK